MAPAKGSVLALALFFPALAYGGEGTPLLPPPQVPAMYVFGDSTVDVGNNNYLPGTNAKADFPPYGIDFPHDRPTGRFSNGYNSADFIASHLGFKRSPQPYLSLRYKTSHHILRGFRGVNFASGGSGILDSTGTTITMTKQIQYFAAHRSKIAAQVSDAAAAHLLSRSLFLISAGGNDLFAFFSQNNSMNSNDITFFIATMVSKYRDHIQALYTLGARKFGISDVGSIGCCPLSRSLHPLGECVDMLNDLALSINKATETLLIDLSSKLGGMTYSFGRTYDLLSSIIANPGQLEVKSGCCGGGRFNGEQACSPNSTLCEKRSLFLFWDRLHPTHASSKLVGLMFYSGSKEFVSPVNLKQLIMDQLYGK